MLERDLLLNATVSILLACLAWLHPGVSRRFGRAGLVLVVSGALLPGIDALWFHLTTTDRIELLSRAPLVEAPFYAVLLIFALSVLAGFIAAPGFGVKAGFAVALGLGTGYATHALLAVLTPIGWPVLAPFEPARVALPILPAGHLPLLLVLLVTLSAAEATPRWRFWIVRGAAALVGVYLLAGAVQFVIVSVRVQPLATADTSVHVYPDGNWLASWQVISEGPDRYELRRQYALTEPLPEPKTMPRWNDQPLFLKLLGDPVVNRYYFRVFHHPVVRLDVSGSQITLLMQELEDQSPIVPGPTFYLESDLSGRNRFYQLQRFN